MANEISVAEKNALAVSYDVGGNKINLDIDFVKKFLVRGASDRVSNQEVVFFMNLCKAQKMNPLSNEIYLIKYGSDPAQTVVGKAAYMRRAFENPDFVGKQDGIVVQRGTDIVQKEGCCLYPNEKLIGAWCRVFYMRAGAERTAYKEVSLDEYNKGQANWKTKPATMLNKVAISQCIREAFPVDYEGMYSEEEMVASGAIPSNYEELPTETVVSEVKEAPVAISKEHIKSLMEFIAKNFGTERGGMILKGVCEARGINGPDKIYESDYEPIMDELKNMLNKTTDVEEAEPEDDYYGEGFMPETDDIPPFA